MTLIGGGCLCGEVRYEYRGSVGPAAYCHCDDCRRCTGSAFNVGIRMETEGFRLVRGKPRGFTKTADSGNRLTRHFCAACGSPVYTSSPSHPDCVFVKAGSLDDPAVVKPAYQSWVSSSVAWAAIPPDLPAYERGRS